MKNFVFGVLLAVSFTVFLSSCSDDEKKEAHPIVGTWILVSESATGCDDPSFDYEEPYPCDADYCLKITFRKDGKFTFWENDEGDVEMENGTYKIEGNVLTLCYPDIPPDCEETGTFEIDEPYLILTVFDEYEGCTYVTRLIREGR